MSALLDVRNTTLSKTLQSDAFDLNRFEDISIWFTVGLGISFLYTWAFLHTQLNYSFFRTKSWLAWQWAVRGWNVSQFPTAAFFFNIGILFFCLLVPIGLALSWGLVTIVELTPAAAGMVILWSCAVFFLGGYALLLWRSKAWRATRLIKILFGIAFLSFVVLELFLMLTTAPFLEKNFAVVFMLLNALPMAAIPYLNTRDGQLAASFGQFVHSPWDRSPPFSSCSPRFWTGVAYTLALAVLGAYIGVLDQFAEGECDHKPFTVRSHVDDRLDGINEGGDRICENSGWIAFANVVILLQLDLAYFLYVRANRLTGPFKQAIVLVLTRLALAYWGDRYWFLGASTAFFFMSVNLLFLAVDWYLPAKSSLDTTDECEDELLDAILTQVARRRDRATKTSAPARNFAAAGEDRNPWLNFVLKSPAFIAFLPFVLFSVHIIVVHEVKYAEAVVVPLSGEAIEAYPWGLAAMALATVGPALFAAVRSYQRDFCNFSVRTALLAVLAVACGAGAGVSVWELSESSAACVTGICLPLILFCLAAGASRWARNDFFLRRPIYDDPEHRFGFDAHLVTLAILGGAAAALWLGLMFDLNDEAPRWHLWTAAYIFSVLVVNALGLYKVFSVYSFDRVSYGLLDAGYVFTIFYALGMHGSVLDGVTDNTSLWLLLLVIGYPIIAVMLFGIVRLVDDGMVLSLFVWASSLFGILGIVGLGVALERVYGETTWAVGLFWLSFFLLSMLVCISLWNTDGFHLRWEYQGALVIFLLFIAGCAGRIAGTQQTELGFQVDYHGGNLALGIVLFYVWALAAFEYLRAYYTGERLLFSRWIFPVFQFDAAHNVVRANSRGPVAVFVGLFFVHIYGVVDTYYATPLYRGFSIATIAVMLMWIFALDCLSRTTADMHRASRFVPSSTLEFERQRLVKRCMTSKNPYFLDDEGVEFKDAIEHWLDTADEVLEAVQAAENKAVDTGMVGDYVHILRLDSKLFGRYAQEQVFRAHFASSVISMGAAFKEKKLTLLRHVLMMMPLDTEFYPPTSHLVNLTHVRDDLTYLQMRPATVRGWDDKNVDSFVSLFNAAAKSILRGYKTTAKGGRREAFARSVMVDNFAEYARPPSQELSEEYEQEEMVEDVSSAATLSTAPDSSSDYVSEATEEVTEQEEMVYEIERGDADLTAVYLPGVDAALDKDFSKPRSSGMVTVMKQKHEAVQIFDLSDSDEADDPRMWKRFVEAGTDEVYYYNTVTGASVFEQDMDEDLADQIEDAPDLDDDIAITRVTAGRSENREAVKCLPKRSGPPPELKLDAIGEAGLEPGTTFQHVKDNVVTVTDCCVTKKFYEWEALETYRDAIPPSKAYRNILKECEANEAMYEDEEFLGDEVLLPEHAGAEWRRLSEMPSNSSPTGKSVLFDSVDADDVVMGALDDSWFLSAVTVLASSSPRIASIFVDPLTSKWGVYACRFFVNHEFFEVIVDDRVPVGANGRPLYARSGQSHEMWVSILEKAFAKLHGGYAQLEGGLVADGLKTLTGGFVSELDLQDVGTQVDISTSHVFAAMLQGYRQGFAMAGEARLTSDTQSGLVSDRAYGILDVQRVKGRNLLKLKNPDGAGEWVGPFSDGDEMNPRTWSRALKARLKPTFDLDDGAFWISFEDFAEQFSALQICRVFSRYQWHTYDLEGEWTSSTAAGIQDFLHNPTFVLGVPRNTDMHVILTHKAQHGVNVAVAFTILHGARVVHTSGARRATRGQVVTTEAHLTGAWSPYSLIAATRSAGVKCKFSFKIYTNQPITVQRKADVAGKAKWSSMGSGPSTMLYEPVSNPSSFAGHLPPSKPADGQFSATGLVPTGPVREYGYLYDHTGHTVNNLPSVDEAFTDTV